MGKVGFIGLGTMGLPMAGHLLEKGHDLIIWNRTPEKADSLVAKGANLASDLQHLAEQCEHVMLCVSRTEDVREVVSAMSSHLKPGSIVVDHSTILPQGAEEIQRELALKNIGFVDAPITGGSMGAEAGTLTIFCGGDEDVIQQIMPRLEAYAKRAEIVGGPGTGQWMKLANQIAVGGALQALCESMAFASKAGLNLEQVCSMLGGGAAGSWAFNNYGPKILNSDWTPGFAIRHQRKDFGYCILAAKEIDAAIPGTELVDQLLNQTEEALGGDVTTAALYLTLKKLGADR